MGDFHDPEEKILGSVVKKLVLLYSLLFAFKSEARFYETGARAKGMAGAHVAVVNDSTAVYWNPAAMAFINSRFSMNINAGAREYTYGEFLEKTGRMFEEYVNKKYGEYENKISYIKDVLPEKDQLSTDDVALIIHLTTDTLELLSSDFYLNLGGSASIPVAVKNYGTGAFTYYMAGGWFVPDLETVGSSSEDVSNSIERLADAPEEPSRHFFTDGVRKDLIEKIENLGGDWERVNPLTGRTYAEDYVYRIEIALLNEGIPPGRNERRYADSAYRVARGTKRIEDMIGEDYRFNKTKIAMKTLFLTEVPISYARKINENLAIGGSLKVLYGVAYQRDLRFMEEVNWDEFKDEILRFGNGKTNLGIDLSLFYRKGFFSAGLIAKNINFPSFDTNTGGLIRLYPQLRGGVGFKFFRLLTLAADMDLYPVKSLNRNVKEMDFSLGTEVDLFNVAFLRGGYKHSLTCPSELGEFGVGLGFNLYIMKLDMGVTLGNFTRVNVRNGDKVETYTLPTDISAEISFVMVF